MRSRISIKIWVILFHAVLTVLFEHQTRWRFKKYTLVTHKRSCLFPPFQLFRQWVWNGGILLGLNRVRGHKTWLCGYKNGVLRPQKLPVSVKATQHKPPRGPRAPRGSPRRRPSPKMPNQKCVFWENHFFLRKTNNLPLRGKAYWKRKASIFKEKKRSKTFLL